MEKNRDNCILLFIEPVEDSKIRKDLKENFGLEEAKNLYRDLISLAYRKVKHYFNAIPIISYDKTSKKPDLTWLDADDPGFVEYTGKSLEDRIRNTFRLAFFTGAKKAILIDPMTPDVKTSFFDEAFSAINDRTAALGLNDDGSFYLLGLTQSNLKVLDAPGFTFSKSGEILRDRLKKAKLAVFETGTCFQVKDNESLKKWNSGKKIPVSKKNTEIKASPDPGNENTQKKQ